MRKIKKLNQKQIMMSEEEELFIEMKKGDFKNKLIAISLIVGLFAATIFLFYGVSLVRAYVYMKFGINQ